MKRSVKLAIALAVAAVLGLSAGIAVATTTTEVSFGQINQVSQTHGPDGDSTTSTTYVNVPGGSQTITTATSGIVLARFSAESACRGTAGGWCSVRLLIDGQEMAPQVGSDFAFDSPTPAGYASHSMDRSAVVQAGTHTVSIQYEVVSGATSVRLDDWSLTLESSAASH
jgi:hypothetical protein